MTAPDHLVWVATVRRGIPWHHIADGLTTLCGRSMRHGQSISRLRAEHDLAAEPCPRCLTQATPDAPETQR